MILSAIAAMAKNRVIGVDNKLPWHLPEDFAYFKEKTKGHALILGRKTFDSLGKPLPGRFHIIITRQKDFKYDHPMVKIVHSLEEAVSFAETLTKQYGDEVFVLGGSEIYLLTLAKLDRIYLTEIDLEPEGDARFPEFDLSQFKLDSRVERPGPPTFRFLVYSRKPA
jgi:dihydrofolate reductase